MRRPSDGQRCCAPRRPRACPRCSSPSRPSSRCRRKTCAIDVVVRRHERWQGHQAAVRPDSPRACRFEHSRWRETPRLLIRSRSQQGTEHKRRANERTHGSPIKRPLKKLVASAHRIGQAFFLNHSDTQAVESFATRLAGCARACATDARHHFRVVRAGELPIHACMLAVISTGKPIPGGFASFASGARFAACKSTHGEQKRNQDPGCFHCSHPPLGPHGCLVCRFRRTRSPSVADPRL